MVNWKAYLRFLQHGWKLLKKIFSIIITIFSSFIILIVLLKIIFDIHNNSDFISYAVELSVNVSGVMIGFGLIAFSVFLKRYHSLQEYEINYVAHMWEVLYNFTFVIIFGLLLVAVTNSDLSAMIVNGKTIEQWGLNDQGIELISTMLWIIFLFRGFMSIIHFLNKLKSVYKKQFNKELNN